MAPELHIADNAEALRQLAADHLAHEISAGIREAGAFHLALAGGSTPAGVYRRLAEPPLRERIEWSRLHIWFGDERCVPPDHEASNFRMASESFLARVPVPYQQVHRIEGEGDPHEAARRYAERLDRILPGGRLDLVLLGLGPDGHVASVFPDTAILEQEEAVAAVYVEALKSWRISLTLRTINQAARVVLLVSGREKAEVVGQALHPPPGAPDLPVHRVRPAGPVRWFLDRDAARDV